MNKKGNLPQRELVKHKFVPYTITEETRMYPPAELYVRTGTQNKQIRLVCPECGDEIWTLPEYLKDHHYFCNGKKNFTINENRS